MVWLFPVLAVVFLLFGVYVVMLYNGLARKHRAAESARLELVNGHGGAASRQAYNDAVERYNNAIGAFPAVILASVLGLSKGAKA